MSTQVDYTVDAVDKAMGLLFVVAHEPGLGVTELAKRSGNTKARAFRLLGTLENCGLVQRVGDSATYCLGVRALALGAAASEQISLTRLAKTYLPTLSARCNETVLLRVRDGLESITVARWESTHAVRIHTPLGDRRPLHVGASGKLLLAYAPKDVQDTVLGRELTRYTPATITNPAKLMKELAKVAKDGYSVSFAERTADTVSIAAPVRDVSGNVIAALSITGPVTRINKDNHGKLIELVVEGAQQLSTELGFAG